VAIAFTKCGDATTIFSVADGRFDRKKIETYASQTGSRMNRDGRELFLVPVSGSTRKISLAFLRNDRIALTAEANPSAPLPTIVAGEDARQWSERFERLAGSPVFAVLRQDVLTGNALAAYTPGGLQSPQLASLLHQLVWVTLAGKPEGDRLRVVAEGEFADDRTARQLDDVLNGIVVLAQTGLNGPDMRRELDPQMREAYLEILHGADISRIDRGETKSVRVVFDVTPKLLDAARTLVPLPSASTTDPPKVPSSPLRKSSGAKGKLHKQAQFR
jgi:hypothetical protein